MKMTMRIAHVVSAAFLALTALSAHSQAYPTKPITFIVPYPPGGMADNYSRVLGQRLSERLGQPVIMDNKPGGSLIVGTQAAAKAAPDGYTLLLASVSSLAINVGAFKKLP
jgi:tripartite-type tricarboxylate transporter receptor subunit TctC